MILLLRHGLTQANEQRCYAGALDLPLSEAGRSALQAYKAAGLYPAQAQAFFTSGMLRCEETLALLYGQPSHVRVADLAEFRFGRFEGKSYEQLKADSAYQAWITDETGEVSCPGGECRNAFERRVMRGYEVIAPWRERTGLAIAVVHGGVIATLMDRLFPGERHFYAWQPSAGLGWFLSASYYQALDESSKLDPRQCAAAKE